MSMLSKAGALCAGALGALGMVNKLTLEAEGSGIMTYIGRFSYTETSLDDVMEGGKGGYFALDWKYEQKSTLQKNMYFVTAWADKFDDICGKLSLCGDREGSGYASKDAMCMRLALYKADYDEAAAIGLDNGLQFKKAPNSANGFGIRETRWAVSGITQSQANFWYFYWVQCDLNTGTYTPNVGTADITLKAVNDGRSPELYQFSTEISGLNIMYAIFWATITVITALWFANQYRHTVGAGNGGWFDILGSHKIVNIFSAVLILQALCMLFSMCHYVNYASNGVGSWGLLNFAQFLDMASQIGMMFLVLCLANGWTITTTELRSPKILAGVMGLFTIIYIILYVVALVVNDPAVRLISWQMAPGVIMLVLRVLVMFYFLWTVRSTYMQEDGKAQLKFYQIFAIGYTVWFLALPVCVSIGAGVDFTWRQKTVEALFGLINFAALSVMGYLLRPRQNEFFRLKENDEDSKGEAALPYDSI